MQIKEEGLSDESKVVLAIIRDEAIAGRLTTKQKELLDRAVALQDALGIIGKFLIWFAGLLLALTTILSYIPRKEG